MRKGELETDPEIFDHIKWELSPRYQDIWRKAGTVPAAQIETACRAYAGGRALHAPVISGLLPPETQVLFTSCLMHRDLANPDHKINLQSDYDIPYPKETKAAAQRFDRSFFKRERAARIDCLDPKVPLKLKTLNTEQFLHSKLRWLTLGEQYDWPTRSYAKHATSFPADLSILVTGLFPHIRPESGVVLIYGAKDFMPVHRDVSEQCQRSLASFSVGCDGIFIMARGEDDGEGENAPRTVAIRVKSGDCVHLSGEARWAWHAMARTIPSTCPPHLADWPVGTPGATDNEKKAYKKWKGYMGTKRINVSCRQVWD